MEEKLCPECGNRIIGRVGKKLWLVEQCNANDLSKQQKHYS